MIVSLQVLNAFRHHSGSHLENAELQANISDVLNAFRHHSGSHARNIGKVIIQSFMCSTPFGITAVLTVSKRRPVQPFRFGRAQRLSASQRFSLRNSATCD